MRISHRTRNQTVTHTKSPLFNAFAIMLIVPIVLAAIVTCYGFVLGDFVGSQTNQLNGTRETWMRSGVDLGGALHRPLMRARRLADSGDSAAIDPSSQHQLAPGQKNANSGKRTLYACEEKQLQIECQLGESIQLIRANYGRFSIQICNEHGQLDWKVNCMSPASYQIIANSCQAKQSCQLLASNAIFGDACPGTQKYLEVHYQCVSGAAASSSSPAPRNNYLAAAPSASSSAVATGNSQQQHVASSVAASISGANRTTQQNSEPALVSQRTVQPSSQSAGVAASGSRQQSSSNVIDKASERSRQSPSPTWPMPNWMMDVPIKPTTAQVLSTNNQRPFFTSTPADPTNSNNNNNNTLDYCPELVWRQIRWPTSEPGSTVQMPCPSHAHSGNPSEPYPASLQCLANGQWAARVQAARCQSDWLRNLSQRLELGDSPVAALNELAYRTRLVSVAPEVAQRQQVTGAGGSMLAQAVFGDDLMQIGRLSRRLVDEMADHLSRISDDKQRVSFARQIVQPLTELVSNLASQEQSSSSFVDAWLDLAPIERQRLASQLVVAIESGSVLLAGALSQLNPSSLQQQQQQQQQPEVDLVGSQTRLNSMASSPTGADSIKSSSFLRVTENAYVSVRSLALSSSASAPSSNQDGEEAVDGIDATSSSSPMSSAGTSGANNRSFELVFPNANNVLGTKWATHPADLHANGSPLSQRFVLKLNASPTANPSAQTGSGPHATTAATQSLKVVFVMLGGNLPGFMDPIQQQATSTSDQAAVRPQQFVVNSNLVSLSIVADARFKYAPLKVDLSAPIELHFRHLTPTTATTTTGVSANRCAYWDTSVSDWLTDGCKLVASNSTHSTCACNHLTTFALLSQWDELESVGSITGSSSQQAGNIATAPPTGGHATAATATATQTMRQHQTSASSAASTSTSTANRVQLDIVESELIIAGGSSGAKTLYLAQLLDGHLFGSSASTDSSSIIGGNTIAITGEPSQVATTTVRLFIYGSCLCALLLLIAQLGAQSYIRSHARRLLGAMPARPPPAPLLVANSGNSTLIRPHVAPQPNGSSTTVPNQRSPVVAATNTPTYTSTTSDGYSAALAAATAKGKLYNGGVAGADLSEDDERATTIDSINYDYDYTLATSWNSAAKVTASKEAHLSQISSLKVPINVLIQLIAVQLLIVLLIESQSLLATWRKQSFSWYQQRAFQQRNNFLFGQTDAHLAALPEPADAMDPIGALTYALVWALIYLQATLSFWLLDQFIQLTLVATSSRLMISSSKSAASGCYGSGSSAQKQQHPNEWFVSNLAGSDPQQQPRPQQLAIGGGGVNPSADNPCTTNLYGSQQQQQQYQVNTGNGATTTISPASSSSYGALTTTASSSQPQQQQHPAIYLCNGTMRCAAPVSHKSLSNKQVYPASSQILTRLSSICRSNVFRWILVHAMPAVASTTIVWFASERGAAWINASAYTMNGYLAQLAYWSLLVDASFGPLGALLYALPSICIALGATTLWSMRRDSSDRSSHWSATAAAASSGAKVASMAPLNPYGLHHQQQQQHQQTYGLQTAPSRRQRIDKQQHSPEVDNIGSDAANNIASDASELNSGEYQLHRLQQQQPMVSKRAKFVCLTLIAFLALHSICWISMFAHIYQALNGRNLKPASTGNHLMYAFATSNLCIALLITWCERRTLRRAAIASGLLRPLEFLFNKQASETKQFISAAPRGMVQQQRQRARQYQHRQRYNDASNGTHSLYGAKQQQLAGSDAHAASNNGPIEDKMSPSGSESLFLMHHSNSNNNELYGAALQQRRQIATMQHRHLQQQQQHIYGADPASLMLQHHFNNYGANQHLYQQLNGPQQHIYDSATTLDDLRAAPQQLNAAQLHAMHHGNNGAPQPQFAAPLNRSFGSLHHLSNGSGPTMQHQLTLHHHNNNNNRLHHQIPSEQQQQQSYLNRRINMNGTSAHMPSLSGEAEGPLVALSSCSSCSSSNSSESSSIGAAVVTGSGPADSNNNRSQVQQQQQQQATISPPTASMSISGQHHQLHNYSSHHLALTSSNQFQSQAAQQHPLQQQQPPSLVNEHRLFSSQQQQQQQRCRAADASSANPINCISGAGATDANQSSVRTLEQQQHCNYHSGTTVEHRRPLHHLMIDGNSQTNNNIYDVANCMPPSH